MYNSIIRALNEEYFLLYSCLSGRYYISEYSKVISLAGCGKSGIEELAINSDEYNTIKNSSINPDVLPIEMLNAPIVTGIMVTNRCNLMCKYCIACNAHSYSDTDTFSCYQKKLFADISRVGVMSVLLSGGEPTLCDDLSNIIDSISDHRYICMLDTNGTLLSDNLISAIKNNRIIPRISLDSINRDVNDYCRGRTDVVLERIMSLKQCSIIPRINTVLTTSNYNYMDELAQWLIDNSITKWHIFKLQTAFAPKSLWLTDDQFIQKISMLQKTYGNKIEILSKYGQEKDKFASFVIDSEGNCFSTNNLIPGQSHKVVFGNIQKQSLMDIWKSAPEEYKRRHYKKYVYYVDES